MKVQQAPSAERFVVHVREKRTLDEVERLANKLGTVEVLRGREDVLVIHLREPAAEPRAAWENVRRILGTEVAVDPVFVDDRGLPHYPTGRITIRFSHAPPDAELERFAEEHGLRVCTRNKFMPMQAVFQAREPERSYLPDLLRSLQNLGTVKAAWADTLSEYRRI